MARMMPADTATVARSSTALTDKAGALRDYVEIRDHRTVLGLTEIAASLEALATSLHRRAGDAPSHEYRKAALNTARALNRLQHRVRVKYGLPLCVGMDVGSKDKRVL